MFTTRPAPEATVAGDSGGGVSGSAFGDITDAAAASAADSDVAVLIPLSSGRRILGALWIVRHGSGGPATATTVAATSAAAAVGAAVSGVAANDSGVVGTSSSPPAQRAGVTSGIGRHATFEFSGRLPTTDLAAAGVASNVAAGSRRSLATSCSIPSSGAPAVPPPAAACYSLLTSPMALQQLSMCASLLLGADAAALAALADCLAAVAGATSFTALVGALTEALAAHVRERYLLEPRVVAAFVPEPSSAVGLLFGAGGGGGGGGGRGTSASAVPANSPAFGLVDTMESPASANRSVHVKEGLLKRSPSTRSMAAAPLGTASPDAKRASAAVAVARVARIVDGAATRAHSESTARRIRRIIPSGPVGLAAAAHVCVPDPTMSSGGHAGGAATGTAGYASTSRGRAAASLGAAAPRVVALSNADVAAIDATAAAGSGVTTLRVKPFPLNNTLLRQLVRKQVADAAAAAPAKSTQSRALASSSTNTGGGGAKAVAAKGAAIEIPDCAAHMQDARMPSRDVLMLLTHLNAATGGGATGVPGDGARCAASVGQTTSQSSQLRFTASAQQEQRSGPHSSGGGVGGGGGGGLRSLLLLALPAGDGRGTLAFYVSFPQQLPLPLLREARGALLEVLEVSLLSNVYTDLASCLAVFKGSMPSQPRLDRCACYPPRLPAPPLQCASALVARKVTGGLAAEVETLATAAPGASYAVVQDHHHRTADLLNAEHGGTRGGSGGQQELMTAPANVMMGFLGSGSLSSAFASSAAGLRGLTASIRSVGGMRAGGGGGAGAGGTSIAIPEDDTERLDPLLASLEPEILYDTGCTDRSGEGRRVVALTSSALNAATMMDSSSTHGGAGKPTGGGGGGTAPAVPTARSRATSANISHGALAMVGIANATAGGGSAVAEMVLCSPLRENTPTGMSPPACGSSSAHDTGLLLVGQTQPRRITRSTSVIHMEEMDPGVTLPYRMHAWQAGAVDTSV